MRIAKYHQSLADFIAYFKFKISFEEKLVRIMPAWIVFAAIGFLVTNYTYNFGWMAVILAVFSAGCGVWCWYCRKRLMEELPKFEEHLQNQYFEIEFRAKGINVTHEGKSRFYQWKSIPKAREVPWYLYLYLGGEYPVIIDKRTIKTVSEDGEPIYIATRLREQSPNYRFVRGQDLTFVGKPYCKLPTRNYVPSDH